MSPPSSKIRKSKVTKACETCRRRKVKCNGIQPCLSCTSSHTTCIFEGRVSKSVLPLYKEDSKFQKEVKSLKLCLQSLGSIKELDYDDIRLNIADINTRLDDLQNDVLLKLNKDIMSKYNENNSIEKQLLDVNSLSFNKFSNLETSIRRVNSIDVFFGLYSPLIFLSPVGFRWMLKRLTSYPDNTYTRETVYLYLKFLDSSSIIYKENTKQRVSPLDWYVEKNNLHVTYSYSQILDELYKGCCKTIKVPHTAIQNVKITHSPSIIATLGDLLSSEQEYMLNPFNKFDIKQLFEFEDKTHILTFWFIPRSILLDMADVLLIESLVRIIRIRHWTNDPYYLGTTINQLLRRIQDNGMNRWEYYLGLDEKTADSYRYIWWESDWWSKWYVISTGKSPSGNDNMTKCLYPKKVMEYGVESNMNVTELINTFDFDGADDQTACFFGRILMSKLIGNIFSDILYNRKFTDYKLLVVNNQRLDDIIGNLILKFSNVLETFKTMKEKFHRILEKPQSDISCFEFQLHFYNVQVSCLCAIESLLVRSSSCLNITSKLDIEKAKEKSKTEVTKLSAEILSKCLDVPTGFRTWRYSRITVLSLVNVVSSFIENPLHESVYYITLVLRTAQMYYDAYFTENQEVTANKPMSEKLFVGVQNYVFILTRIVIQVYLMATCERPTRLIDELKKVDKNAANVCVKVLDISSNIFEHILNVKPIGEYHKVIYHRLKYLQSVKSNSEPLNSVNNNDMDDTSDKSGDPSDDGTKTNTIEYGASFNSELETPSYRSLEEFLDEDLPSEFFLALWKDPGLNDTGCPAYRYA